MSYFLIFLAVIVAGLVALFLIGSRRRELGKKPIRSELAQDLLDEGLAAPVPNLPPVLLPERPGIDDVERVRFSLGLRGYRMDQVDQVLDRLGLELAVKDAYIEELQGRLDGSLEPDAAELEAGEPEAGEPEPGEFDTGVRHGAHRADIPSAPESPEEAR